MFRVVSIEIDLHFEFDDFTFFLSLISLAFLEILEIYRLLFLSQVKNLKLIFTSLNLWLIMGYIICS